MCCFLLGQIPELGQETESKLQWDCDHGGSPVWRALPQKVRSSHLWLQWDMGRSTCTRPGSRSHPRDTRQLGDNLDSWGPRPPGRFSLLEGEQLPGCGRNPPALPTDQGSRTNSFKCIALLMCQFPGLLSQRPHAGGQNQQESILLQPGDQKSKVQVSAGLAPSGG